VRLLLRRIRGALGTAVLWATSWFVASFGLWTALHLFLGVLPMSDPWALILAISTSSAASGFITGLAFSAYLRITCSERSLLDLRAGRLALGGGGVAAGVSLLWSLGFQLSTGLSVPLATLVLGSIFPLVLGGVTAGGSIRAAQHAARRLTGPATDELELEQQDALRLLGDSPT